jgi:AraC-like DNA-binding protein
MQDDQVFLESSLSVGELRKLGIPAHQLRVVINGTMGFRNFRTFISSYRIALAKQRLIDPDFAHLPILTIAFDVGYSSIASFNRAFHDLEDLSPSVYRRRFSPPGD